MSCVASCIAYRVRTRRLRCTVPAARRSRPRVRPRTCARVFMARFRTLLLALSGPSSGPVLAEPVCMPVCIICLKTGPQAQNGTKAKILPSHAPRGLPTSAHRFHITQFGHSTESTYRMPDAPLLAAHAQHGGQAKTRGRLFCAAPSGNTRHAERHVLEREHCLTALVPHSSLTSWPRARAISRGPPRSRR